MNSQAALCQNCKQSFTIEPEDFAFYEKIKVPPPTWCPECRRMRRMTWRNERALSWRNCELCKKKILSIYANPALTVYCRECWYSDAWNPTTYGQDYDFSRPFFVQYNELLQRTPHLNLTVTGV